MFYSFEFKVCNETSFSTKICIIIKYVLNTKKLKKKLLNNIIKIIILNDYNYKKMIVMN